MTAGPLANKAPAKHLPLLSATTTGKNNRHTEKEGLNKCPRWAQARNRTTPWSTYPTISLFMAKFNPESMSCRPSNVNPIHDLIIDENYALAEYAQRKSGDPGLSVHLHKNLLTGSNNNFKLGHKSGWNEPRFEDVFVGTENEKSFIKSDGKTMTIKECEHAQYILHPMGNASNSTIHILFLFYTAFTVNFLSSLRKCRIAIWKLRVFFYFIPIEMNVIRYQFLS